MRYIYPFNGRTLFSIKTNLRENRFFAASWQLVHKKGTHGVILFTENLTFLHHCHGLQQAIGAEFWILAYLCSVLRTWEEWLSWFCITKIIYSYQYWFTIAFCSPWFCIPKIICSYQYWFTIAFCSPCFCITKIIYSSQVGRSIKSQAILNLKIH